MALATLILACFIFYGTSKYFPAKVNIIRNNKNVYLGIASALLLLSLFFFNTIHDGITAFFIWLTCLMTVLSAMILSIGISSKWIYFWVLFMFSSIIIDVY